MYLYVSISEWNQDLEEHMAGARLPWEGIVLSNYQPPNRQAQRGRKPLIWVFAYESAKEFPRLLCDSWTGSIWVSNLWRTTEEMWNIVWYVWCCRILSSEHNDHRCLNQKSCDSLQETPRFMPVHIFSRKKMCGGDGEGCQILSWDSRYSIQHHPLQMNVSVPKLHLATWNQKVQGYSIWGGHGRLTEGKPILCAGVRLFSDADDLGSSTLPEITHHLWPIAKSKNFAASPNQWYHYFGWSSGLSSCLLLSPNDILCNNGSLVLECPEQNLQMLRALIEDCHINFLFILSDALNHL